MTAYPKTKPIRLSRAKFKELQKQVVERDNYTCQKCGRYLKVGEGAIGHTHHIKFLSQGGSDTADNLELLCFTCHDAAHGIPVKENN